LLTLCEESDEAIPEGVFEALGVNIFSLFSDQLQPSAVMRLDDQGDGRLKVLDAPLQVYYVHQISDAFSKLLTLLRNIPIRL
jgi:hypothetical protein